jgi:hypothetical protein
VIEALGLNGKSYALVMKHLAVLSCLNLLLSWLGLLWNQHVRRSQGNHAPYSNHSKRSTGIQDASMEDNRVGLSRNGDKPLHVPTIQRM